MGSDGTNDVSQAPSALTAPIGKEQDSTSAKAKGKRQSSGWFGAGSARKARSDSKGSSTAKMSTETNTSGDSGKSRDEEGEEVAHDRWRTGQGERERLGRQAGGWGVGEDAAMGLS